MVIKEKDLVYIKDDETNSMTRVPIGSIPEDSCPNCEVIQTKPMQLICKECKRFSNFFPIGEKHEL